MKWVGKWENQYGSILEIFDDADNRITGRFRTALTDSSFYGMDIEVSGVHQGDCIGLSGGGTTSSGDMLLTYTGLFRDHRLETLWHVVTDCAINAAAVGSPGKLEKQKWWRAMATSSDTFRRID